MWRHVRARGHVRTYGPRGPYARVLGSTGSSVCQRAISHPFFRLNVASTACPCQVPVMRAVASPPYSIVHCVPFATGANGSFFSLASCASRSHAARAC